MYSTDCKCKKNKFKDFKEAREHLEICESCKKVYYEGPYSRDLAYKKEKGIENGR